MHIPMRRLAKWLTVTLWAALIASWIISYWVPHGVIVTRLRRYALWLDGGFVQVHYGMKTDLDFTQPGRWTIREVGYVDQSMPGGPGRVIYWGQRGMRFSFSHWPPLQEAELATGSEAPTIDGTVAFFGERIRVWAVPFWLPFLVLSAVVIWIGQRAAKRYVARRYGAGYCPKCGYDLRASPERCPECGAVKSEPSAQRFGSA